MVQAFLNAFALKFIVEVTYKVAKAIYKKAMKKSVTSQETD